MKSLLQKRLFKEMLDQSSSFEVENSPNEESIPEKKFHKEIRGSENSSMPISISSNIPKSAKFGHKNKSSRTEDLILDLNEKNFDQSKSTKFEWVPCSKALVEKLHRNYYTNKDLANKNFQFVVEMDKNFLWDKKLQWHWHKTLWLPTITVREFDSHNDYGTEPYQLQAKLSVIKKHHGNSDIGFDELGLSGDCKKPFHVNKAAFSRIKFGTTSHLHEEARFNLVVSVILKVNFTKTVIGSYICPSVFVNAANQDATIKENRKQKAIFNIFDPTAVEKVYLRKEKIDGEYKEEIITNTLEGLKQYLAAVNIKKKIKHPLFLFFKFWKCVKIFYNPRLLQKPYAKEREILENLLKTLDSVKSRIENKNESQNFEKEAFLIFHIDTAIDTNPVQSLKPVVEYLQDIQHESMKVSFSKDTIPSNFLEASPILMTRAYEDYHKELLEAKKGEIKRKINCSTYSATQTSVQHQVSSPTEVRIPPSQMQITPQVQQSVQPQNPVQNQISPPPQTPMKRQLSSNSQMPINMHQYQNWQNSMKPQLPNYMPKMSNNAQDMQMQRKIDPTIEVKVSELDLISTDFPASTDTSQINEKLEYDYFVNNPHVDNKEPQMQKYRNWPVPQMKPYQQPIPVEAMKMHSNLLSLLDSYMQNNFWIRTNQSLLGMALYQSMMNSKFASHPPM